MTHLKIVTAFVALMGASQAFAVTQTCSNPTTLAQAGIAGVNSCDNNTYGNAVGTVCLFNNNPSNDVIFQFTLGPSFTATGFTLTNHTGTFQPQMIIQSSCGSSSDCTDTANAASAGAGAAIAFSNASPPLAAGTYFLIVDGTSQSSAADCGTFDLAVTSGTLPVKLQKFSIQ